MPAPLPVTFSAVAAGPWRIERILPVKGETLPPAFALDMRAGETGAPLQASWSLSGVVSNIRYATRGEMTTLAAKQEGLGRDEARCAALIPIRKSEAWWALAQDERRAIFEERSRHTAIGLETLPQVARRLHHCRDLVTNGAAPPFDFLTWFEFAPEHTALFDAMLDRLRASEEWTYVAREVDIRLSRI
jgi:hypothetical protein